MVGILGEFIVVSVSWETKHEKNQGKFGGKFRRKSGTKIRGTFVQQLFKSVHTRCIVKTSGFTRGVCKNRGFY